tara:strand:+ start:1035 stop:1274 length:240 start_codon:yes stop_codon:yes gene_type:complete
LAASFFCSNTALPPSGNSDYETLPELEAVVAEWVERYNRWRPHTANGGQTPWQAYCDVLPLLERDLLANRDGNTRNWLA